MAGKPPTPGKTQVEDIADLKKLYVRYFREFPVQRAAAHFIGRSDDTILLWKKNDTEFLAEVNRAQAEWAQKASRRVRPDNLLANLYEETRPPKQEIEASVTTVEGKSAETLIAEAKALGLDTTPYESLVTGQSDPGTPGQDPDKA